MTAIEFPPFTELGPERMFRVTTEPGIGNTLLGEMKTGAWTSTSTGAGSAGSIGILIDDVLAHAVAVESPDRYSTVTTHIHTDYLTSIATDGTLLRATVTDVSLDRTGGLVTGIIADDDGAAIAHTTLRARFVPIVDGATPASFDLHDSNQGDAISLIGAIVENRDDGADLTMTIDNSTVNVHGNLHGGVTFCAAEMSATAAIGNSAMTTSSVDITYLRPATSNHAVTFQARTVHEGRQLAAVHVTAINPSGKKIAVATVTMQRTG